MEFRMTQKYTGQFSICNHAPWLVQARSKPSLEKPFAFFARQKAHAHLESIQVKGFRAKLIQLATFFQLRLCRRGGEDANPDL